MPKFFLSREISKKYQLAGALGNQSVDETSTPSYHMSIALWIDKTLTRPFNKDAASMTVDVIYWVLTLCFGGEDHFLEKLQQAVYKRVNNVHRKIERLFTDVWVDSKYIFVRILVKVAC